MFEPGQKVMVVKSNFTGKTGPKVGSLGFVSDIDIYIYGFRFHKIVWYKFGNQDRYRMEGSPFGMLVLANNYSYRITLRDLGCRRGGVLVPVLERKRIEDMEDLEFNCWLYSIMRIPNNYKNIGKLRAAVRFGPQDFNPRKFKDRIFHVENRLALAGYARELKSAIIKQEIQKNNNYLMMVRERIHQMVRKGYSTARMVDRVIMQRQNRYEYFYEMFMRMAFLGVAAQKVRNEINSTNNPYNVFIKEMYREWRRLHGIDS